MKSVRSIPAIRAAHSRAVWTGHPDTSLRGNGETWVPLDEQLGIGDGQTPACEYHLGQFAGLAPYQRSLRHFHTIFRPLDCSSTRASGWWTRSVRGWRRSVHEIKDLFEHDGSVEVAAEITGTMVVCIDAGKVPIKGNQRVDDAKRNRYDREFRDVKVASISALDYTRRHVAATPPMCLAASMPMTSSRVSGWR